MRYFNQSFWFHLVLHFEGNSPGRSSALGWNWSVAWSQSCQIWTSYILKLAAYLINLSLRQLSWCTNRNRKEMPKLKICTSLIELMLQLNFTCYLCEIKHILYNILVHCYWMIQCLYRHYTQYKEVYYIQALSILLDWFGRPNQLRLVLKLWYILKFHTVCLVWLFVELLDTKQVPTIPGSFSGGTPSAHHCFLPSARMK